MLLELSIQTQASDGGNTQIHWDFGHNVQQSQVSPSPHLKKETGRVSGTLAFLVI
jgi:hypothetical protein